LTHRTRPRALSSLFAWVRDVAVAEGTSPQAAPSRDEAAAVILNDPPWKIAARLGRRAFLVTSASLPPGTTTATLATWRSPKRTRALPRDAGNDNRGAEQTRYRKYRSQNAGPTPEPFLYGVPD
jgi:hypothetical protein